MPHTPYSLYCLYPYLCQVQDLTESMKNSYCMCVCFFWNKNLCCFYSIRAKESENRKHCLLEAGNSPNMPSKLKKSMSQSTPRIMSSMKEAEVVFEEEYLKSAEDNELDAFLQVRAPSVRPLYLSG